MEDPRLHCRTIKALCLERNGFHSPLGAWSPLGQLEGSPGLRLFFSFPWGACRGLGRSFASTLQPVMLVMIPRGMRRPKVQKDEVAVRLVKQADGRVGRSRWAAQPLGLWPLPPDPDSFAPENCDGWALHERTGEFKITSISPTAVFDLWWTCCHGDPKGSA